MAILILTQPQPAQPFVDALGTVLPDERLFVDEATAYEHADEVETILLWRLQPGLIERFKSLRFLAASAAGVDKILGPALTRPLPVTRTVDAGQNQQIAQYVCTMVLRHLRQLPLYESQQRERRWQRHPVPSPDSIRIGLLGSGESGQVVARALQALGFAVSAWSRSPKSITGLRGYCGAEGLAQMLPTCQALVCLLPLTPDTQGIVNARLLRELPTGALFINVARGGHVDEEALAQALHSGQLGAAVLDVQSREPLPTDDPLWEVPRLLITPHVASLPSPDTVARQLAENLWRARQGQPLLRIVDAALGY